MCAYMTICVYLDDWASPLIHTQRSAVSSWLHRAVSRFKAQSQVPTAVPKHCFSLWSAGYIASMQATTKHQRGREYAQETDLIVCDSTFGYMKYTNELMSRGSSRHLLMKWARIKLSSFGTQTSSFSSLSCISCFIYSCESLFVWWMV